MANNYGKAYTAFDTMYDGAKHSEWYGLNQPAVTINKTWIPAGQLGQGVGTVTTQAAPSSIFLVEKRPDGKYFASITAEITTGFSDMKMALWLMQQLISLEETSYPTNKPSEPDSSPKDLQDELPF